jgi:alkylation response protein AidB-like acyl-CoA dehydrogenase
MTLSRVRDVLDELAQGAAERDLSGEHPYELVQKLADAGFGKLRVPTEFGGFDVDLPTLFELLAEAGQADSNIPQIWRGHFTTTEILRKETNSEVREKWLRAIGEGAVFGNAQSETGVLSATVRTLPDGPRVVTGKKFYSTGARFADFIRAAVLDEDGNRVFVVVPARHPAVTHVDDWDGIGQRQTGSGTTIFDDVPVLGDLGSAPESLLGLDSFVQIVHLANLAGIARSLVAETVSLVRGRSRTSVHGLTPTATEDPEVLGVIGTLQARRLTADALLRHAAQQLEAGDYVVAYQDTSAAQIAVIEAVLDAATLAFHAGGSSAVRQGAHLDRHWRNARTLASHNPVVYKPRLVGDYLVNGAVPVPIYLRGRS